MSQRKSKLIRKVALRFHLNLNAIKRTYRELSHLGKQELSIMLQNALKEADARRTN